jgi:hypothetical protein
MNWKSSTFWATAGSIVAGALVAFGLLKTDEGAAVGGAVAQIAGGVLTIVGVVAAVRARKTGGAPANPTP